MKIILEHLPLKEPHILHSDFPHKKIPCVATIGVFDGIHRGHQHILKEVVTQARGRGIASLMVTFDVPPQRLLKKEFAGTIMNFDQKKTCLTRTGIDYVWFLRTTDRLLGLSAQNFLIHLLRHFSIKLLCVGEGFRFGRGSHADSVTLDRLARRYGFALEVIKKRTMRGRVVSSSLIRRAIEAGNFSTARRFLGRDYIVAGRVVRGRGIGRTLGFPTANIICEDYVIPKTGVYAAVVRANGRLYRAAVNIGTHPTVVPLSRRIVEAHCLDFHGSLTGHTIEILFIKRMRDERKFPSRARLVQAINKDVEKIKRNYSFRGKKVFSSCLKI
ncbi:MAG: bifunctional riboflavin kinase/FAD synthetase [Candidatus Omnitrophota bacterium]|nr:bifunctional riboflavin kinase/FAD synthetase [Candidatus Omnitrophota bacterium]